MTLDQLLAWHKEEHRNWEKDADRHHFGQDGKLAQDRADFHWDAMQLLREELMARRIRRVA